MQEWSPDTLFEKAKAFADNAFTVDPRSDLFPLLASFSLEALGKAALAKIHPALIGDPRGEGQNILYAFGVPTKDPRTIVAKTVFSRLVLLVPGFSEDDAKACLLMAERRNRHLHTGEQAYDGYKSGVWLPDFYRAVMVLTDFMGRDVVDFLGKARTIEASQTTAKEDERIKSEVSRRIKACSQAIRSLNEQELAARRQTGEPRHSWISISPELWMKAHACPACQSKGALTVKHVSDRPAEIVDSTIYVDSIYSPRKFECRVCGLIVSGVPELRVAGLADEIVDSTESDPAEYFDIEVASSPYDDYGNE
ncbi:hypothetical protein [Bradyrhizobium sp. 151]|uniref:hypothetical protein n=1 Tax=Bradyrhizobium sp. 151 TaxID=2782626 RepID=UPI001FF83A53|nr:hypothetical protein [Bradyrhizobium sp. 151]MCK1661270.1 hypothetical protein [Bradyrhizobium sp. 151]